MLLGLNKFCFATKIAILGSPTVAKILSFLTVYSFKSQTFQEILPLSSTCRTPLIY
jgi:hypothetical protein